MTSLGKYIIIWLVVMTFWGISCTKVFKRRKLLCLSKHRADICKGATNGQYTADFATSTLSYGNISYYSLMHIYQAQHNATCVTAIVTYIGLLAMLVFLLP